MEALLRVLPPPSISAVQDLGVDPAMTNEEISAAGDVHEAQEIIARGLEALRSGVEPFAVEVLCLEDAESRGPGVVVAFQLLLLLAQRDLSAKEVAT